VNEINGDTTKANLGLDKKTLDNLTGTVDAIYHLAAITDLNNPIEKLRRVNVDGTKNVLDFAMQCKNRGKLKKVNHISTAYVAGKRSLKKCRVMEDDLDLGQGFNNGYEQSKCEGEKCVNEYRKRGLDIDIFRPGIILGRYKDGVTTNFKMMYQPLHFFSLGLFDRIPAPAYNVGNLINLDVAAQAICSISSESNEKNMTYHVVSPETISLDYFLSMASEYFGFKKPEFVPVEKFDIYKEYTPVKRKMVEPYLPYFNYAAEFDMTNTLGAFRGKDFVFPEFDDANFTVLFEYCAKAGFIKRKNHAVIG
jgi:thioester reductase-like protein